MSYDFDPELAPVVPVLPISDLSDPVAAREMFADLIAEINAGLDLSGLTVIDHDISCPDGPDVLVRVYEPVRTGVPRAALLYIHGGGFIIGSIDAEQASASSLAADLGIVVVSVEYRLAPEHPFPAGLDDCTTALAWLHDRADDLEVDTTRVGVCGQSAGGRLAAALALRARDRGGPPICWLLALSAACGS